MPPNRAIFIVNGRGRQDFFPFPLSPCNYCQIWASVVIECGMRNAEFFTTEDPEITEKVYRISKVRKPHAVQTLALCVALSSLRK